jgi:hypothetical protein
MRRKVLSDRLNSDSDAKIAEPSDSLLNMSSYASFNASKISAEETLLNKPSKHGYVQKKSNSFLVYCLPCFYSQYQPRYLVLVGAYLYRFKNPTADSTKGIPIPIEDVSIAMLDSDSFEVKTIRKSYVFIVGNETERNEWMEAIKQRKHLAIKERMGHAPLDQTTLKLNRKSEKIFYKKLEFERQEGQTTSSPFFKDPMIS